MCKDLNIELKKAQGVTFAYLPNPNRLHKPLLGITRIDFPWVAVFYLSAWDLIPDPYNPKKKKKANAQAIAKLHKKFRAIAKESGVTIGRGANVNKMLQLIQDFGSVTHLLEYEKAEALLTALHYIYVGGVK